MLAFIDESGHPHPNDSNERPVVVAVCIEAEYSRLISGRTHALKRDILNRTTYRRKPDYAGFAEAFFNTLMALPITVFTVVTEAPFILRESDNDRLPNRFRYVVQRGQLLSEEKTRWRSFCSMERPTCTRMWAGSSTTSFTDLRRAGACTIMP